MTDANAVTTPVPSVTSTTLDNSITDDVSMSVPEDQKSKVIMDLERTIREQSQKLAAYQAEEEYKLTKNREDMRKKLETVPKFFDAIKASLPDQEQETFGEDMLKAQTFLQSVPNMDKIDMDRHAPLVTVACKASGTLLAMETLRKDNQDKDLALKRSLESGEEKDRELAKRQKDIDHLTQLAESRQAELEKQVKEYQDLVTRVSRHDFSAPAMREYNNGMEAMRKHAASKMEVVKTETPAVATDTTVKTNDKAPIMASGMSATERALLTGGATTNSLMTTTLNASAGSNEDTTKYNPNHNPPNASMHDHVRSLREMVLSNSKPSTQIYSAQSRGASSSDAPMTDTERILAAIR